MINKPTDKKDEILYFEYSYLKKYNLLGLISEDVIYIVNSIIELNKLPRTIKKLKINNIKNNEIYILDDFKLLTHLTICGSKLDNLILDNENLIYLDISKSDVKEINVNRKLKTLLTDNILDITNYTELNTIENSTIQEFSKINKSLNPNIENCSFKTTIDKNYNIKISEYIGKNIKTLNLDLIFTNNCLYSTFTL